MIVKLLRSALLLAGVMGLAGCGDSEPPNRTKGVYMLLDTSGTYTEELDKARDVINYTLSRLEPGDSFAIARVDTGSFSEKDIVAKVTFDSRPSAANTQKRRFQDDVATFVQSVKPAAHTDISGGLLQALEYLEEKQPGRKTILIFSDMKEDLEAGYVREFPLSFTDVDVIALNVTKLRSDNVDPREYIQRMDDWQERVERGGGRWRVINDLDHLGRLFG